MATQRRPNLLSPDSNAVYHARIATRISRPYSLQTIEEASFAGYSPQRMERDTNVDAGLDWNYLSSPCEFTFSGNAETIAIEGFYLTATIGDTTALLCVIETRGTNYDHLNFGTTTLTLQFACIVKQG